MSGHFTLLVFCRAKVERAFDASLLQHFHARNRFYETFAFPHRIPAHNSNGFRDIANQRRCIFIALCRSGRFARSVAKPRRYFLERQSFKPSGPGEIKPGFDQQKLEPAIRTQPLTQPRGRMATRHF